MRQGDAHCGSFLPVEQHPCCRAILHSYADVSIIINAHTMSFGHKNPEYTIDGQLGDRKVIMGEKLSKYISRRKADFVSGMIAACYVVFNGEAVVVNASVQTRQEIMSIIEMLNPCTSSC